MDRDWWDPAPRADTTDGYFFRITRPSDDATYANGTLTIQNDKFRSADLNAKTWLTDGAKEWFTRIIEVVDSKNVKLSGTPPNGFDWAAVEGIVQPGAPQYTTLGPVNDCTITGNTIAGGYYGIGLHRATNCYVAQNTLQDQMRNISIQSCSENNDVYDNTLWNAVSTAVHMAYGARDNTVRDNNIGAGVTHGGDNAAIQDYVHGYNNNIYGNTIRGGWRSGIYVGAGSQFGSINDNDIGDVNVGINAESDWIDGMGGAPSHLTRSNSVSYITAERFTYVDLGQGNIINAIYQDMRKYELPGNAWGESYPVYGI